MLISNATKCCLQIAAEPPTFTPWEWKLSIFAPKLHRKWIIFFQSYSFLSFLSWLYFLHDRCQTALRVPFSLGKLCFPPLSLFSFPFQCFLTLKCSILEYPELRSHLCSGSALHLTIILLPQGGRIRWPPKLLSTHHFWDSLETDRARSSPCPVQYTIKHLGPLLHWVHGSATWGW